MKFNLKDRKTQLALGGAGAVVAFALYKHQQASAASSSGTGTATPGSVTDALDASSLENNIVGDIQPQIDALQSAIAGLSPAGTKPTTTTTPGGTVAKTYLGQPKPAAPVATPLPQLNSAAYALKVPASGLPNNPIDVIGSIIGPGGLFQGRNLEKGAPLYALVSGSWLQNVNPATLPVGTKLGTFSSLKAYITPNTSTEKL